MSSDDEYKVGFGKPPTATRFKKGQSGNPAGRPKGATSNRKRIRRMLEAPMPVKIGDQVKTMSTFDLSLQRVSEGVRKADKGAVNKAIQLGLELDKQEEARAATAQTAHAAQPEAEPLSAEDHDIILDYLAAQKALRDAF
jgi:hypothetical protein